MFFAQCLRRICSYSMFLTKKGGWRVVDNIRGKQIHLLKLRRKHEDDFVSISAHNLVYQQQLNRVDKTKIEIIICYYQCKFIISCDSRSRPIDSIRFLMLQEYAHFKYPFHATSPAHLYFDKSKCRRCCRSTNDESFSSSVHQIIVATPSFKS